MTKKLNRILSKKNFQKFIEEGKLILSKPKLAEHFEVSVRTLYRWMHRKGFTYLLRGHEHEKPKEEPKKVVESINTIKTTSVGRIVQKIESRDHQMQKNPNPELDKILEAMHK